MSKTFTPVSLDGRQQYYELWARTPQRSLDYTLANLWGWQDYYGLEWCFDDNLCWIRQTRPYQVCWAPVGDWNAVSWKDLLPCGFNPEAHNITRVPEKLLEIWQRDLPASGVHIELANAALLSDADVYYAATREELYVHNVSVLPAVKADGQPVVTFYGAAAQDIDLVYLEDIGDVYVDYDRVKPQIKLDYILTEGDGYVSYELDTAYNFEFTVTTQTGEDKILVVSERSDVK